MSDLIKKIYDITTSKSYIDYNKYHKGNLFGITKTSRMEHMHSNFIAWLLDSKINGIGTYPCAQFIKMLSYVVDRDNNKDARFNLGHIEDDYIIGSECERETVFYEMAGSKKKRSIDIIVSVRTNNGKILPIVIENKVDTGEHDNQTKAYFDWAENKYSDRGVYLEPVYVFLLPEYNEGKVETKEYITIKYQDLVDYVIEPSMWSTSDREIKTNIDTYLQCLSYQADSEKGAYSMAISSEERKILNNFIKQNKNLLCAVINELEGVSDEAKSSITSNVRNFDTYILDGVEYKKARLVLAIVKKYVDENTVLTFKELEAKFPAKLQGSKGVVKLKDSINDKDKGIGGQKRYFLEPDEIIDLPSSEIVCVSTQWGDGNIRNVIDIAVNDLGYDIKKA